MVDIKELFESLTNKIHKKYEDKSRNDLETLDDKLIISYDVENKQYKITISNNSIGKEFIVGYLNTDNEYNSIIATDNKELLKYLGISNNEYGIFLSPIFFKI